MILLAAPISTFIKHAPFLLDYHVIINTTFLVDYHMINAILLVDYHMISEILKISVIIALKLLTSCLNSFIQYNK